MPASSIRLPSYLMICNDHNKNTWILVKADYVYLSNIYLLPVSAIWGCDIQLIGNAIILEAIGEKNYY